jgi:photosystem II stability/assembly factor-like uncharacterized protein
LSGRRAVLAAACVLLALPAAASAQVDVGHSGWYWGNPLPQGNTLSAVELVGDRAYAAGAFGTVLGSDDRGTTWSGLASTTTADLNRVAVIDADSVVVGGGCTLRRSDDGGRTFRRLRFAPTELRCASPLRAFSFPSERVGYLLLQSGAVLRTTDAGETFSERAAVPGTQAAGGLSEATDVAFDGDDAGVAVSKSGAVYRTAARGDSWTPVAAAPRRLNGVHFASPTIAYAVGEGNLLLRSEDGGSSWAARPLSGAPFSNLTGIRCAGTETCLITTEAGDRLLRTTNGGASAAAVRPLTQKAFAATVASDGTAIAVGELGATALSRDYGATFQPLERQVPGAFNRIRAASPSTAYAVGEDGRIARTTDTGRSWTGLAAPTADRVLDASFATPDVGFAIDSAERAHRTDDGGATWRRLNTRGAGRLRAVVALNRSRVLLVGVRGVWLSRSGGDRFAAVRSPSVRGRVLSDVDRVGNFLVAWAPTRLVYSSDGGRSWRRMRRPPRARRYIRAVDFVSPRVGFLARRDGRLWGTRNRGRTWRLLSAVGAEPTRTLAFTSGRDGFVAPADYEGNGQGGYVLRTSDGGRSWRPQLVAAVDIASIAVSGGTAFGLAATGDLFATTTGGDIIGRPSTLRVRASRRTLRGPGRVRIGGRLTPPEGGEVVRVAMRAAGGWSSKSVEAAADGRFTTTWRVRRNSVFVAQWRGDDDRAGDGTAALRVRVLRR